MKQRTLNRLLDQIDAKDEREPLTNEEVKALFFWCGYSDENDLLDYDAD